MRAKERVVRPGRVGLRLLSEERKKVALGVADLDVFGTAGPFCTPEYLTSFGLPFIFDCSLGSKTSLMLSFPYHPHLWMNL